MMECGRNKLCIRFRVSKQSQLEHQPETSSCWEHSLIKEKEEKYSGFIPKLTAPCVLVSGYCISLLGLPKLSIIEWVAYETNIFLKFWSLRALNPGVGRFGFQLRFVTFLSPELYSWVDQKYPHLDAAW